MYSKKHILFYSTIPPDSTGAGNKMRILSNILKYCYSGMEVVLFLININKSDLRTGIISLLNEKSVKIKFVNIKKEKIQILDKIRYIFGFNKLSILNFLFPYRAGFLNLVKSTNRQYKNSVHHFEYLSLANVAISLNGHFIWSNHDLVSKRHLIVNRYRQKNFKKKILDLFKSYRLKQVEKMTIQNSSLILCISETEAMYYSDKYNSDYVKYLPFSPPQLKPISSKKYGNKQKLKIIHLGSLNSIITYSSLSNFFKKILPRLNSIDHEKIELLVVGDSTVGERSKKILELSKSYSFVKIFGYHKDLTTVFKEAHCQLVASSISIGARTRIIESFGYGIPVLSTVSASKGIHGLKHMDNILLGKDNQEMALLIKGILSNDISLKDISKNSIEFFNENFNLKKNSKLLSNFINEL